MQHHGSNKMDSIKQKSRDFLLAPKNKQMKAPKPMTVSQQRYHRVGVYKNTVMADEFASSK